AEIEKTREQIFTPEILEVIDYFEQDIIDEMEQNYQRKSELIKVRYARMSKALMQSMKEMAAISIRNNFVDGMTHGTLIDPSTGEKVVFMKIVYSKGANIKTVADRNQLLIDILIEKNLATRSAAPALLARLIAGTDEYYNGLAPAGLGWPKLGEKDFPVLFMTSIAFTKERLPVSLYKYGINLDTINGLNLGFDSIDLETGLPSTSVISLNIASDKTNDLYGNLPNQLDQALWTFLKPYQNFYKKARSSSNKNLIFRDTPREGKHRFGEGINDMALSIVEFSKNPSKDYMGNVFQMIDLHEILGLFSEIESMKSTNSPEQSLEALYLKFTNIPQDHIAEFITLINEAAKNILTNQDHSLAHFKNKFTSFFKDHCGVDIGPMNEMELAAFMATMFSGRAGLTHDTHFINRGSMNGGQVFRSGILKMYHEILEVQEIFNVKDMKGGSTSKYVHSSVRLCISNFQSYLYGSRIMTPQMISQFSDGYASFDMLAQTWPALKYICQRFFSGARTSFATMDLSLESSFDAEYMGNSYIPLSPLARELATGSSQFKIFRGWTFPSYDIEHMLKLPNGGGLIKYKSKHGSTLEQDCLWTFVYLDENGALREMILEPDNPILMLITKPSDRVSGRMKFYYPIDKKLRTDDINSYITNFLTDTYIATGCRIRENGMLSRPQWIHKEPSGVVGVDYMIKKFMHIVFQGNVLGMATEHMVAKKPLPAHVLVSLINKLVAAGYKNPLTDSNFINPRTGESFWTIYQYFATIDSSTNKISINQEQYKEMLSSDRFTNIDFYNWIYTQAKTFLPVYSPDQMKIWRSAQNTLTKKYGIATGSLVEFLFVVGQATNIPEDQIDQLPRTTEREQAIYDWISHAGSMEDLDICPDEMDDLAHTFGFDLTEVQTRPEYQNFQFIENPSDPGQYFMPPPCYNPFAPYGQEKSDFWVKRVMFYYYNRLHSNDYLTFRPELATVGGFHLDSTHNFQLAGPDIILAAQTAEYVWTDLMAADLSNWVVPNEGHLQLTPPQSTMVENWMAIQVFETLHLMINEQMGDLPIEMKYSLLAGLYGFTDPMFWIYDESGVVVEIASFEYYEFWSGKKRFTPGGLDIFMQ
ncbi:MAG: hypothetical protein ACTSYI_05600, partial [Promethearchaeota archaeon]